MRLPAIIVSVFFVLIILFGLASCSYETVPAGNVGVKVNLYGGDKGVQQEVVGAGRYWLTWNEQLYLFPLFNQLHSYAEPFNFQTLDAMKISATVGVEYKVNPDKVVKVFTTYRKGVEEITEINLRQNIADSLIKHSGTMNINTLAGEGRTTLLNNVTEDVKAKLAPVGIDIVRLSWTNDLNYPQQITDAINAKIQAAQKAVLRENEIAQSRAEAQKRIEEAKGQAESVMINARAEADAISLRGQALKQNPEVMQLEAINKWNGVTPVYMTSGAQTPFITLPAK